LKFGEMKGHSTVDGIASVMLSSAVLGCN